jgi:hypothetical protein
MEVESESAVEVILIEPEPISVETFMVPESSSVLTCAELDDVLGLVFDEPLGAAIPSVVVGALFGLELEESGPLSSRDAPPKNASIMFAASLLEGLPELLSELSELSEPGGAE